MAGQGAGDDRQCAHALGSWCTCIGCSIRPIRPSRRTTNPRRDRRPREAGSGPGRGWRSAAGPGMEARRRSPPPTAWPARGGLDAVAALAGQPEKPLARRSKPATGVLSAAKQRRPAQRLSIRRIGKSKAVSIRSAQMATSSAIGLRVAGLGRSLVGGRAQEPAGVRLDVPLLGDIADHWPGLGDGLAAGGWTMMAVRRLGDDAERAEAGSAGHGVGPGAGGVHQHHAADFAIAQLQPPAATDSSRADQGSVGAQAAPAARAPPRKPA